jgi:hypothetical protein
MDTRQQRGLELAALVDIRRKGKAWLVPSQRGGKCYAVDLKSRCCTCPDHGVHKVKCKHIYAVEYTLKKRASSNHCGRLPNQRRHMTAKQTAFVPHNPIFLYKRICWLEILFRPLTNDLTKY